MNTCNFRLRDSVVFCCSVPLIHYWMSSIDGNWPSSSSNIFWFELASFQFNHHIAAEVQVVDQYVNVEVIATYI